MRKHSKKTLSEILSKQNLVQVRNSYDIIGDIAIIRLPDSSGDLGPKVAEALMNVHKNVKTVMAQTGGVCGDFRVRQLKHLSGIRRTVTVHKESGCLFSVDVGRCYFSPRLSYERMRVARQAGNGEVVVNMFAGVGCFSILIAKYSGAEKVYSIDVNPTAFQYMRENIRLNRVYGKVVPILGEAQKVIERKLCHKADRVLMPLPEKAFENLPYALLALKKTGGWIHYHDFEHARKDEDAAQKVMLKVWRRLENLGVTFEIPVTHVVRTTGPNWYQVVLDIEACAARGRLGKNVVLFGN